MGATRNAVLSVAAAGLLIVGLLVLIPEPAGAVIVTPTAVSSQVANGDFTVVANVEIPAEEHIPIVSANVRVGQVFDDGTDLVDTTGGCNAETGASPSATIIEISGLTDGVTPFGGPADFSGYGYGINPAQYGYSLSDVGGGDANFAGYDSGTGYGYGYNTPGKADTVAVKVLVSGCAFTYSSNVYRALLQIGVGAPTDAAKIYSAPIEVSFVDPTFTTVAVLASGTTLTGTGSTSGDFASFQFDLGFTGNLATSSTVRLNLAGILGGAQSGNEIVITAGSTIPAGSSFTLTFLDVFTDPTMNNNNDLLTLPPFGILATSLNSLTITAPLVFFTLNLNIPGQLDPDENAFISSFVVSLDVLLSEVPGGLSAASSMRLFGFDSTTGAQDSSNGLTLTPDCTLPGPTCRFTFTVDTLSSFAMSIGLAGGGGGGGAVVTTTTTSASTTVTSTDTTTSSVSDTGSESVSTTSTKGKGKGGSAPGLEFGLLVGALAGIALLARRNLK